MAFPRSCQAALLSDGRVVPAGNPCATESSAGEKNLYPTPGTRRKNPCAPPCVPAYIAAWP